ncbi:hypothetical protein B0178_03270 [Streptococcus pseudopneumoniae]|nr:hypothetical protein B0177_06105 [Streptococcus pseudopneumoniae]OOR86268.1 hypothetical protein B0178_03270 [Streptococcus pseudopneumoniae]
MDSITFFYQSFEMLRSINAIRVLKVFREPDLKKARKASQLVNVNSKELLYFKRAHFQRIFSFGFNS